LYRAALGERLLQNPAGVLDRISLCSPSFTLKAAVVVWRK
jgi:hypothetical protein